jgi:D-alanine--poly(phosphoribitol) ligase subunit 1
MCKGSKTVARNGPVTALTVRRRFYIAFTSGSTGTPKGVQIGYDNFGYFYGWYSALLQCCRGTEAHVNHASLSFDMGMLDLWPAISLGPPTFAH